MYGFMRVGAAVPKLSVGDCSYNKEEILTLIYQASEKNVKVLVFPELAMSGYTCGDLFYQSKLLESCELELLNIIETTSNIDIMVTIGVPVLFRNNLYNCAVSFYKGSILGIIPKQFLPNHSEFYEKRWFMSGIGLVGHTIDFCNQRVPFGTDILFNCKNFKNTVIGVEICGDLWTTIAPSCYQAQAGANVILNLSASNDIAGKSNYRESLISVQSSKLVATYVYCSAGACESSTDLVFGGHTIIVENGTKLVESSGISFDGELIYSDTDMEALVQSRITENSAIRDGFRYIDVDIQNNATDLSRCITREPLLPDVFTERNQMFEDILTIQSVALCKRLLAINVKKSVVAISGGLDSTLALLCTVKSYDRLKLPRENIIGITMPGFGTTGRTYENALSLMKSLGITMREIPIREACEQHFKDIGHDINVQDITYENAQARERTQIAMDIANKENAIVIGTGDLSELALGFTTYNGDHMSMYGVNAGITKTIIQHLVKHIANSGELGKESSAVLLDIVNTPISPELVPSQATEDIVGPYILHDFFLYYVLKYGFSPKKIVYLAEQAFCGEFDKVTIVKWLEIFYRRFFTSQFKRSCAPDGPKILEISLSPRGDWRMPSDSSYNIWIAELSEIL